MIEQVMIQINFKEITIINGMEFEYNDALYFTQAEYQTKSQGDIDTLKQERITNWINTIKNASTNAIPTKAELQEQKMTLEAQLTEINIQLLTAKDI